MTIRAESDRLQALDRYAILDTAPEQSFDDLAGIAAALCGVPISLVSFVAGDRQWFKAEHGLGARETSRGVSFCAHTIATGQTLVVEDAQQDPRFRDNDLVTGSPGIRFYAGAPMIETDGHVLGTVCVIDQAPRALTPDKIHALEGLARQAVALLEQRRLAMNNAELAATATAALHEATRHREQLQLALDAATLAAWYYDPARDIVGGDERLQRLFGITVSEAPAEVWLRAILEEDRERVGREFAASLAGQPYNTRYRIQVDGRLRWLHARARSTLTPDGSVQLIGICEDVSQEELLAADLAKTAARLTIAQNVSGAVTFDWDAPSDTLRWGGTHVLGRSAAELSSLASYLQHVLPQDRSGLEQVIAKAIADGKEYLHEFRMLWPDGSTHWVATLAKPLLDDTGKVTSILGVNIDITDRKLSEEALRRTEKLAAVGRLASVISHEINNPLEAVTNLLYIVRMSPDLLSRDRDHLDLADRELARVAQITAQTLRFHKNSTAAANINATAMVKELLALYRTRLSASGIEVRLDLDDNLAFNAFESDIRQVLNNLVGNAFDAMRKGGILYIRTHPSTDARTGIPGASIIVADSGSGIPAHLQPGIFEAFHSTKGNNGTGLGLWISRRIVHKHKGHLWFRSTTGTRHGTVFRLWLPKQAAATAAEGWA